MTPNSDLCSDHGIANEDPLPLQSNETAGKKPRKVNSVRALTPVSFSHFIPAMMPKNSPILSASYLAGKPSHHPYLHENNQ